MEISPRIKAMIHLLWSVLPALIPQNFDRGLLALSQREERVMQGHLIAQLSYGENKKRKHLHPRLHRAFRDIWHFLRVFCRYKFLKCVRLSSLLQFIFTKKILRRVYGLSSGDRI
jgi:hypothetical protein